MQEEPQSLEQAIDTQSQEHIAETQSPLKSRASSVGGASEELLEPDTQVEEEGVRDIDEGVLLDLSQEQRDTTPEPKSSGPAIDTEPSERHIEETQGPVKSRESPVSSASEESAESGIPSAGERIEEAAINTEPLTHIEEKQGPVEARESSVSALSEEGEEPGKQSVEKRIEEVDKHPLSESSPEEQNNISSPQVQEKYVVEPPVDKGKQASITTGESVRKELTQQPDSVTELEEAAATASADQESATHTIPERDFIPKAAVGPVAEPSIAYRGFPYDPIARTTPAYKRLPYDPVTATGTASKEQPYNPITASETASRGLPYDPVIASKTAPQGLPYDPTQDANTKRRDFAIVSQTDIGTTQDITSDKEPTQLVVSNPSSTRQEQHAQVVHTSPYLSTQNNSLGLVLPTTEELDLAESDHATPKSRHDSSQEETPKPEEISKAKVSSEDISIPPAPPSTSFEEFDSLAPAALRTPVTVSPLLTNMAEKEPEVEQMSDVKRRFHAIFEKNREQSGSSGVTGTRSPSIIPDKSPQQAGPPSLRNVAALNSALVQGTDTPGKLVSKPDPTVPEVSSPPVLDTLNVGSETNADAVEDQSDGDVSSDLEDDLILLRNEYIVPTAMESIQKSTYDAKVTKHKEILTGFVKDPHSFQAMGDLKKFFSEIIAIETHVDFDIPESSQDNAGTQSQTRWTEDTAAKFRFLGLFLHQLRHMELRVILVVKEENDHLFSLIEKFLKGKTINYYNRARQRGAAPKEWDGSLQVEILPSEPSYVAQPADVIVCLDDVTAADVRRKSWARNHDRADPLVTVLRLVVPRSLSHIQLCVSPKLSEKDRLHREAACLLQFRGLYGRPLSPKTPRPHEAAEIVAQYIMELDNVEGRPDWPLPGIGSVKEVVEYASPQTQTTTDSAASSIRGVSTKRQLVSNTDSVQISLADDILES